MNQIEIWLSILARKLLKRGSFTSIKDLQAKVFALHRLLQSHDGQTFQVDLPGEGFDYLNSLPDFRPNEWQCARLA
jgi:hypothetical protein